MAASRGGDARKAVFRNSNVVIISNLIRVKLLVYGRELASLCERERERDALIRGEGRGWHIWEIIGGFVGQGWVAI